MKARTLLLALAVGLIAVCAALAQEGRQARRQQPGKTNERPSAPTAARGTAKTGDYVDPMYGSKIRQIRNPGGCAHNFYYYRNPWNADGSYLLVIRTDAQQKNWRVVLYDGDGVFIKELFGIDQYDWRLTWDRNNPGTLYTWKGSGLYQYNVKTGKADLLRSFAPLFLKPNGPSLNQAGDRILVATSDNVFRSYRLPDMGEERTFTANTPPGCNMDWGKPRYTGYRNCIDTAYRSNDSAEQAIVVYGDTGAVVHKFDSIGGGGHYDFSPDGRLAYFKLSQGPRSPRGESPLEIHIVKLDGTDDRVLFSVPRSQAAYVQNLHLSWPAKVNDWFIASLFPSAGNLPADYAPPLDEILLIHTDGTHKYLARTETAYSRAGARAGSGDLFWAQPLGRPSADGKRICFNSNRSGTIDLYILYTQGGPPPQEEHGE